MRRGLTDGKWKYIRNFNPDFPTAPYSFYQFGQPGWTAYQKAFGKGKLSGYHKALWEAPGTSEQLYDLSADPWEMNNLAADPAHAEKARRPARTPQGHHEEGAGHRPRSRAAVRGIGRQIDPRGSTSRAINSTSGKSPTSPSPPPRWTRRTCPDSSSHRSPLIRPNATGASSACACSVRKPPPKPILLLPLLKDKQPASAPPPRRHSISIGKKDIAADALVADIASEMDSSSLLNLLNTLRPLRPARPSAEKLGEGKKHEARRSGLHRAFHQKDEGEIAQSAGSSNTPADSAWIPTASSPEAAARSIR